MLFANVTQLSAETSLLETTWKWYSLVESQPAALSLTPEPAKYTVTFTENGALQIKADCNMAQGSYTGKEPKLSIMLGPSTMAACGERSLDIMYLSLLGRVESYTLKEDKLILNLQDDKGHMTFKRD